MVTLHDLFDSCPKTSSNIVYYDGIKETSITYKKLHENVSLVSAILNPLPSLKSTVCCLIQSTLALPAIILGILKTNRSFAFLDFDKSLKTLLAFRKYISINTIIVEDCYLNILEPNLCSCWKRIKQFHLHSDFIILQSQECINSTCSVSTNIKQCTTQTEIAYAIQTSGTTGEPKIVQVPHECITSNIIDLKSRFSVSPSDVLILSTRITFDPSVIEIFLALSSGATLIIIHDHIRSIPKKICEVLIRYRITIFQATPSLIFSLGEKFLKDVLLGQNSQFKVLAFGGEICPSINKLKKWKSVENETEIFNLYGLTEVSCWASCFKIDLKKRNSVPSIPLGDSLLNTKLEIYNDSGDITDKGELYVGGFKRFCIINDEEWPENSDNFMRSTGDLVYKVTDNLIYFEGRKDCIVKYKGHKIPLQFVTNTIDTYLEIENHYLYFNCLLKKLYLFVVWDLNKLDDQFEMEYKLKKKIRRMNPNLPSICIVSVPYIPLTPHGKVNLEKLIILINTERKTPISFQKFEEVFQNMWKEYTNQEIAIETDNFILKGGDSISAVQFVTDIEWKFQLSIPMLVDTLLNETFNDAKNLIKSCLTHSCHYLRFKEEESAIPAKSSYSPLLKRKHEDLMCYKLWCKQGYFEKCFHSTNLRNCLCDAASDMFGKVNNEFNSIGLSLTLTFKCDLKKCIDATPCVIFYPQSSQTMIFIGSHFGQFSCIDVCKREEVWHIFLPNRIESSGCVSACGNYVLIGCYDHNVYCFNISDGSIHWKIETNSEVKSSPSVSCNNVVFFGSHDKHVYAIGVESGHILWKKPIAHGSIFSSPAVIENIQAVCVASLDGIIALIKMESGDILWKYFSGKPLFSSSLISCNFIFIGSTDNSLLCIDFNGSLKFKYSTNGPVFSSCVSHITSQEDHIVFGCHDCYVYCITSAGELVWRTLCDSAVYATPCIFKQSTFYVCVASSQGTLYILHMKDGKVVCSIKLMGEIFSSPIVFNNYLVVGCRDNNMYCYNIANSV